MSDEQLALARAAPAAPPEDPHTGSELAGIEGVARELARCPLPSAQGVVAATAILLGTLGAMALFTGGLPVMSLIVLTACAVGSIAFGASALRRDLAERLLAPEAIVSGELRAQYRAVLLALQEVTLAAAEATRLHHITEPIVRRCRDLAAAAGRMALLTNPMQRYLDRHAGGAIARELERIRHRAADTADATTSATLGRAVKVRTHQLALRDEMAAKQERLLARLEVVGATLEETAAAIVKMQVLGDEQAALTSDATEDLEALAEELDTLTSVFEEDLVAQ